MTQALTCLLGHQVCTSVAGPFGQFTDPGPMSSRLILKFISDLTSQYPAALCQLSWEVIGGEAASGQVSAATPGV